jgi:hypothetical protein
MNIVTTLSPSRVERQQKCINSWREIGLSVIAVQAEAQVDLIRSLFSEVNVRSTHKVADQFGKPLFVRVHALLDQCLEEPGLIVNSDIQFVGNQETFRRDWDVVPAGRIRCGIRYDVSSVIRRPKMFKWGIDAFLITPEIAAELPDIGLAIGIPCWDYWIPMHFHRKGWQILTKRSQGLLHEMHPQNWSKQQSDLGYQILLKYYGMKEKQIVDLIQTITGRKILR